MKFSIFLAIILSSCAYEKSEFHKSVAGDVSLIHTAVGLGDKSAYQHSPDGTITSTHDESVSFGNATTAITTYGIGQIAGSVYKAKEVTKQMANTNATKVSLGAQKAATDQAAAQTAARASTTDGAIKAGAQVTPITVTPP